ncbi:MAG: hypothetical protein HC785_11615 [Calothrix sp. CSU_2_0]|nr:hypothetical protein [Calothrix sp. CSU_2_0]
MRSVIAQKTTAYFGETIDINWEIENIGTAKANNTGNYRIWLSSDDDPEFDADSGDIQLQPQVELTSQTLDSKTKRSQQARLSLPLQNNLLLGTTISLSKPMWMGCKMNLPPAITSHSAKK